MLNLTTEGKVHM